jgi:hypothetical protein
MTKIFSFHFFDEAAPIFLLFSVLSVTSVVNFLVLVARIEPMLKEEDDMIDIRTF